MGSRHIASSKEFVISGTGNAVGFFDFHPAIIGQTSTGNAASTSTIFVKTSGRLRRFYVRQDLGGGATSATFYFSNRQQYGSTVTTPSSTAKDKFLAYTSSVPLTASATAPSLDTPFDTGPVYKDNLSLVADVVGSGAWTIRGFVEITEG